MIPPLGGAPALPVRLNVGAQVPTQQLAQLDQRGVGHPALQGDPPGGHPHLLGMDGLGTGNGKIGQADRLAFAFASPGTPVTPMPKVAWNWARTAWAMAMALAWLTAPS